MRGYSYHKVTKEFLEEIKLNKDERQSRIDEKDVWLIPADTALEKPTIPPKDHVMVWNGTSWYAVIDNRGKQFWDVNGDEITIDIIGGVIPEGVAAITNPPPPGLCTPFFNGKEWTDAEPGEEVNKLEYELMIYARMRKMALNQLQHEGQIPKSYK